MEETETDHVRARLGRILSGLASLRAENGGLVSDRMVQNGTDLDDEIGPLLEDMNRHAPSHNDGTIYASSEYS
ncbi:hypothetical protein EYZ11_005131 [Aspergillus tanneri]|uniref:Uncharacterized protein n=1 Tax=Aspergillus tanneri TaxID=1220188 RepID=A0A4S3JL38_9EURO|nr:hypothetical protein EYZ11_005131 [Aspergillus tanneri]